MVKRKLKRGQIITINSDDFDEDNTYILISSTKETIFACNPKTHKFISVDRSTIHSNLDNQNWIVLVPDEL